MIILWKIYIYLEASKSFALSSEFLSAFDGGATLTGRHGGLSSSFFGSFDFLTVFLEFEFLIGM